MLLASETASSREILVKKPEVPRLLIVNQFPELFSLTREWKGKEEDKNEIRRATSQYNFLIATDLSQSPSTKKFLKKNLYITILFL